MCVIIYVPKTSTISKTELLEAWNTNPHGAGYSIQKNGRVEFKRGFMKFQEFNNEIEELIGKYNLLLHFRISTSKSVNKMQTHPYKKGNVTITQGSTTKPVICMNGVISGQTEYKGCNDTMSYICDHQEAFASINQDILNIIQEATGAKWAVMKPNEVLLSSKFEEYEGRWYSNKNHLIRNYWYSYQPKRLTKGGYRSFNSMIKSAKLRNAIKRDKNLYEDVSDMIEFWCRDDMCNYCTKCFKSCKTLRDVKIVINENYYDGMEYMLDDCCAIDYDKDDEDLDERYENLLYDYF